MEVAVALLLGMAALGLFSSLNRTKTYVVSLVGAGSATAIYMTFTHLME